MKKKIKAEKALKAWVRSICYECGVMHDGCLPQICKGCGEGAWLIEDIKHKRGCEVNKIQKNLQTLVPKEKCKHD